jgi:hypothetical protein
MQAESILGLALPSASESDWKARRDWNLIGGVSGGDKFDSCGGRKSDSRQHGLAAG